MKKLRVAIGGWNGITWDIEKELVRRGHTLYPNFRKADVLVVWNEVDKFGNAKLILDAKERGAKTILIQHGFRGVSRIHAPFNDKLLSDIACVWGQGDVDRLVKLGVPKERMIITGNPLLRKLKPRVKHEGINVVFAPEHWGEEVSENFIVASALRKMKGVNVITKCLVGEQALAMYDNVVTSDRATYEHMDIVADVLSKADVVVAITESTFSLLAEILDIPVVIADIWIPKSLLGDESYKDFPKFFTNACTRVQLPELEKAIMFAVKHPEHLREERKQIGIYEGGTNIPDPVNKICDIIES